MFHSPDSVDEVLQSALAADGGDQGVWGDVREYST